MRNIFTIIILTLTVKVFAQSSGSIDLSFGGSGTIMANAGIGFSYANGMQIQKDGKIILAGYSLYNNYPAFTLVRYNTNGTPDNSFGTNGIVFTSIGLFCVANAIILQNDNKIIASGWAKINDANNNYAVARYNSDGSLDYSFGIGGIALTNVENSSTIYSTAIQSSGKIILSGYSSDGSSTGISHVRFNTNGTIDTTFGSAGIAITKFSQSPDVEAWAMALDVEDRIVTTGMFYDMNTSRNKIALNRFLPDGNPDSTFGTNGMVVTSSGNSDDFGNALAIQADGKIIVAASSGNVALVIRYNENGSQDSTFGNGGIIINEFEIGLSSELYGITILQDSKIVVVGVSGTNASNTNGNYGIACYNSDGSNDSNFGINGKVITDISNGHNDVAFTVKDQSDGKIVVSGISSNGTYYNMSVARYNGVTTTIARYISETDIKIYPNPSKGKFTVEKSNTSINSIKIYNVLGKEVYSLVNAQVNNAIIDLYYLSKGIYFVKNFDGEKIYIEKIIIQ